MEESDMRFPTKLMTASMLALFIAAPTHAQSPNWAQQGDYYRFQPWRPQTVSPGQERRIQQGDYYKPRVYNQQHLTAAQRRRLMQGDWGKY
jgi:hypothetical protein